MSERFDRGIRGTRQTLWVIIIIAAVVLGGVILWLRLQPRGPLPAPPQQTMPAMPSMQLDEPLPVVLFLPASGVLTAEQAGIARQPDTQLLARQAVSALLTSPRGNQVPVLRDFRLQALYLDSAKTAYVDLAPAAADRQAAGSAGDELLAIAAVTNTLTQNFEEIKQVHLLIDGKEAQTLAGHIDLSRPFTARPDLVRQ